MYFNKAIKFNVKNATAFRKITFFNCCTRTYGMPFHDLVSENMLDKQKRVKRLSSLSFRFSWSNKLHVLIEVIWLQFISTLKEISRFISLFHFLVRKKQKR